MFEPVSSNVDFPKQEELILAFWKERRIYEKSLERRLGATNYVFYEGPPTANGMPHPGHCLTRAIKDVFPRYRTMRGYFCERKAGWDTHGLPVEVEVCKELGIHSKDEIEAYGVEPFIHKCQESVWRYMQEWERLTERLGFWIHLDEAYVTYHKSYVESVWWSLKNLFDRGLLYQGHKIVWWWAQGGTALSAGEVGQGYREVADPSVYVKFPLLDEQGKPTDTSLLVWTTTPWTLPSNQFAAVHPDLEYATVVDSKSGEKLILATALIETIASKVNRELTVESNCKGTDLEGRRYIPPFDYYYKKEGQKKGEVGRGVTQHIAWRVVCANFVTVESGTGVVHQAPAFGEVDYEILVREQRRFKAVFSSDLDEARAKPEPKSRIASLKPAPRPKLINAVAPDGKFTAEAPDYQGRWVKDCDKDIARNLRDRGLLFHLDQYLHEYPFCWRAEEDPLIQYPRKSWFIKTTQFKDEMLANNQQINWLPEHIKSGRFGNFLESNVDWTLSRERFWGTPLPIWVCNMTGKQEAIACYNELLGKPGVGGMDLWDSAKKANPELPDDLKVHKPYIDEITYDSPFAKGATMRRVTEVIDCWYDSGAMPFAQWGYPHQGQDRFRDQFPADFISEALDQTRGWFYSQLAISTLLFSQAAANESADAIAVEYPHPFRNCIVLGLMLGEDGQKMSKSKRNYREPGEIFDKFGADALRWYFFANQPPWTSIRYKEQAIKDSIPEFLLRLWNVFSFFNIYANIDEFDPDKLCKGDAEQLEVSTFQKAKGFRPHRERGELDRWIASESNRTIAKVIQQMDAYDNYGACSTINDFVDSLSNWYVRRSRDRFWAKDKQAVEKLDAYWTLYECLVSTSKLIAPFVPFLAEAIWQNLAGVFKGRAFESVHLCDYPTADLSQIDEDLSRRMKLLREIASLGRSARMEAKLKVRQPLSGVKVVLANTEDQAWLVAHEEILKDELNVKKVEYVDDPETYIDYMVQPNFKSLGPRVGKLMPKVKSALGKADGASLLNQLTASGKVTLNIDGETVELDGDDIQVRLQAKPGWAAAQGGSCVVVLATELTEALIREGLARDLMRLIQDIRKELDLKFTDRIKIGIVTKSDDLIASIKENEEYIKSETLAVSIVFDALPDCQGFEREIGDVSVTIFVQPVSNC